MKLESKSGSARRGSARVRVSRDAEVRVREILADTPIKDPSAFLRSTRTALTWFEEQDCDLSIVLASTACYAAFLLIDHARSKPRQRWVERLRNLTPLERKFVRVFLDEVRLNVERTERLLARIRAFRRLIRRLSTDYKRLSEAAEDVPAAIVWHTYFWEPLQDLIHDLDVRADTVGGSAVKTYFFIIPIVKVDCLQRVAVHLIERKCRPSWRELAEIINAWLDQVSPASSPKTFATPEGLRMALLRWRRSYIKACLEANK
jgi:hypothetical protein